MKEKDKVQAEADIYMGWMVVNRVGRVRYDE